jgi:uncharacterized iron-regulated membrane protein
MTLRTVLRRAHAWIGLTLSLLLLALALSGAALVYKESYWRLVYPELRGAAPPQTATEQAAAIATAEDLFGHKLRLVEMPTSGVPAYHLYLTDGEAFLALDDYRVIDRWRPSERLMAWLFDMHAHLLAGDSVQVIAGVVALLGVFLVLTGIVLWWPARRTIALSNLLPRSIKRPQLIALHRDLGLYTAPISLILLLTGAGIVFYGGAGVVLNGMFGDPPMVTVSPPPRAEIPTRGTPDAATITAVREAVPEARLVRYHHPAGEAELHLLRLKRDCELHPNGRTYVYADGAGHIVLQTDPCTTQPGERALHAIYPIHAGKTQSALYKLVTFLGGLALSVLAASGAFSYSRMLLRRATA